MSGDFGIRLKGIAVDRICLGDLLGLDFVRRLGNRRAGFALLKLRQRLLRPMRLRDEATALYMVSAWKKQNFAMSCSLS